MVLETTYRRLFFYIPYDMLAVKTLQCDPLPPPTAVTVHNDAFFEGTEDLRAFRPSVRACQRAQQGRVLTQMIPDRGVREQLQAFFSAMMPEVQERFPEAAA